MARLIGVMVVVLALAGSAHAELLINGDFEAGLSDWGNWGSGSGSGPGAYKWWGNAATTAPTGGSDGGQYAILDTTAMDGHMAWWGWVWQGVWQSDLPATEGETLTVEGFAKVLSPGGSLHVFYEWEDATGTRVDYDGDGVWGEGNPDNNDDRTHLTFDLVADGSWNHFTQDVVVPSGLTGGPIAQFNVLFSAEGAPYTVGIDQVSVVPEPATLALLGLGGLLLRRRR